MERFSRESAATHRDTCVHLVPTRPLVCALLARYAVGYQSEWEEFMAQIQPVARTSRKTLLFRAPLCASLALLNA